jgi:hypothetical protein
MTSYYRVLQLAVDGLDTALARRTLYERARTVLAERLRGITPPLPEAEITRERLALEEAVIKLEVEATQRLQERLAAVAGEPQIPSATKDQLKAMQQFKHN